MQVRSLFRSHQNTRLSRKCSQSTGFGFDESPHASQRNTRAGRYGRVRGTRNVGDPPAGSGSSRAGMRVYASTNSTGQVLPGSPSARPDEQGRPATPTSPHPPVIPGYTEEMKTAISVPDNTYERVSKRARELGMSRSELFSQAAARYLDELDAESVTRQIDLAVASLGQRDDSAADAVAAGRRTLAATTDEW